MALKRWEPFKDVMTLQERMNRVFNEFFSRPVMEEEGLSRGVWSPAVDICETENEIILKAELPGMKQEDIQLEIRDNVLVLKGERKSGSEVEEGSYHRLERPYGAFQRTFTLPGAVRYEEVRAKYKDGLLEVVIPRWKKPNPSR